MRPIQNGTPRLPFSVLLLAVWLGFQATAATVTAEEEHDFDVLDSELVYLGSGAHPSTPAAIRADDVWAEIPEYKRIVDEELTDDDAEYHLLMKKATERFQKALKKEAKRSSYDLIAEEGAVRANNGKKIPDATEDLIELVSRD